MNIIQYSELDDKFYDTFDYNIEENVKNIINDVKQNGDKAVKKLLEGQHRLGESGLIICRAQTWAVDLMIIQVCQRINEIYQKTVYGKKKIKFAVVAFIGHCQNQITEP